MGDTWYHYSQSSCKPTNLTGAPLHRGTMWFYSEGVTPSCFFFCGPTFVVSFLQVTWLPSTCTFQSKRKHKLHIQCCVWRQVPQWSVGKPWEDSTIFHRFPTFSSSWAWETISAGKALSWVWSGRLISWVILWWNFMVESFYDFPLGLLMISIVFPSGKIRKKTSEKSMVSPCFPRNHWGKKKVHDSS